MSNQAPTLDQRRKRTPGGFTHVVRFLDHLGVPYNKACGRGRREGFWQRNDGELEYIYKDAKKAYAEAAKKAHPDNGGSHQAMTALNEGWALLKRQFGLRCRELTRLPAESEPRCRTSLKGTQKAAEQASKARKYRWAGHVYVDERRAALSPEARAQKREKDRLRMRMRRSKFKKSSNCCRECGRPASGNYCDLHRVFYRVRNRNRYRTRHEIQLSSPILSRRPREFA